MKRLEELTDHLRQELANEKWAEYIMEDKNGLLWFAAGRMLWRYEGNGCAICILGETEEVEA